MQALKREVELLKTHLSAEKYVHFEADADYNIKIINPGFTRTYVPVPTLQQLHKDLEKYTVCGVRGPYGSGKSVWAAMCAPIIAAQMMPPCLDGVRRCKAAFIRNTYEQLKQTTYEMAVEWYAGLGYLHSTQKPLELKIKFTDKDGPIELYIQFIALDKPAQYSKLRSSFFTFAYINEVSESPEGVLSQVLGRTGRYPSADRLDVSKIKKWYSRDVLIDGKWQETKIPYWSGVIFDTNPPDVDSEIYNIFEKDKPKGYHMVAQPPGLFKTELGWEVNRGAENIERLGLNYYAQQAYGATQEFIKVFCCGEYGSIRVGKLVYEDYNDDIHTTENLALIADEPIHLAFDTAFQPACVIYQYVNQQMRVYACLHESGIFMLPFVEDIVKPYLSQTFPEAKIGSVTFDPAGMVGEKIPGATSEYSILRKAFDMPCAAARTNKIEPRLNAVQFFLAKLTHGQPAFVMDKQRCDMLRKGFLKYYVWQHSKASNETIYQPFKNKFSHVQDALQYAAIKMAPEAEGLKGKKQKPGTTLRAPVISHQGGSYAAYY